MHFIAFFASRNCIINKLFLFLLYIVYILYTGIYEGIYQSGKPGEPGKLRENESLREIMENDEDSENYEYGIADLS